MVVWKRDLYIAEGLRQLDDTEFYEEVDIDPTNDHQNIVRETVSGLIDAGKLPADAMALVQKSPRLPTFYMLPKIHKQGNPGRPIVSTINCPTELISQYLDSIFSPMVQRLPTYVKDSSEMIRILDTITLPAECNKLLFTMDVRSLYTNIPRSDGLEAVRFFLRQNPTPDRPDDDAIIRLTELVLDLTAFGFNDVFYRQKKGVAMGTKMGPSYACLFMGHLETRILTNCGDNKPLLVRRYIDDFFCIAASSEEEVKNFIGEFNTYHPSIKVTHEISSSCITFLDINVSLKDTGVSTSVHYKPTDSHAYLNYTSSHPASCKRSIPYSQFTRIRRLCSEEEDFKYQVDNMSGFFTQRGYPEYMVDAARQRITTKSRDETLRPRRGNSEARVPFVLTYHPTSELVVKAIRDNLNILQTDETTSDVFSDPPLISYRKDRSLKRVLVKSSLPSLSEEDESSDNTVGTPCRRPRCKTCGVISPATEIKGPKSVWKLKKFSCTTSNCIYAIHCKKCRKIYIGETKRRLADRVAEHLRSIRLRTPGLPVAQHFNMADHNPSHFEVSIMTYGFPSDKARKEQEERLIYRLGCLQPNGINVTFRSFPM